MLDCEFSKKNKNLTLIKILNCINNHLEFYSFFVKPAICSSLVRFHQFDAFFSKPCTENTIYFQFFFQVKHIHIGFKMVSCFVLSFCNVSWMINTVCSSETFTKDMSQMSQTSVVLGLWGQFIALSLPLSLTEQSLIIHARILFPVRQIVGCLCGPQHSMGGTLLARPLLINQHLLMEREMKEGERERRIEGRRSRGT